MYNCLEIGLYEYFYDLSHFCHMFSVDKLFVFLKIYLFETAWKHDKWFPAVSKK